MSEIVNRPTDSQYNVDELVFLVNEYFKARGFAITVNVPDMNLNPMVYQQTIMKLINDFEIACNYFKDKGV